MLLKEQSRAVVNARYFGRYLYFKEREIESPKAAVTAEYLSSWKFT